MHELRSESEDQLAAFLSNEAASFIPKLRELYLRVKNASGETLAHLTRFTSLEVLYLHKLSHLAVEGSLSWVIEMSKANRYLDQIEICVANDFVGDLNPLTKILRTQFPQLTSVHLHGQRVVYFASRLNRDRAAPFDSEDSAIVFGDLNITPIHEQQSQ
jgi:hypothetical protein